MSAEAQTNTEGPLVSVVVPTYNYAHFIGEAFESLRAQTYARWECVVVDDGSTDDTERVVREYAARDPRVRYLRQRNRRQAAAKNLGLGHSSGVYVQFLDADDMIEPRKFERQVEYLESHPEVDIVYGGVRYFTERGVDDSLRSVDDDNQDWMPRVSGRGREMVAVLLQRNIMVINAPLVRRAVLERVGPFDERLPPAEDWDYWLRSAAAGAGFEYVDEEGARALVRAHAASSSRNRAGMYRSMLLMREKFPRLSDDAGLLALNRRMTAADRGYLGVEEAAAGRRLRAAASLLRAAAAEPSPRGRAKWLACALAAPFVGGPRLRRMIAEPLRRSVFGRTTPPHET